MPPHTPFTSHARFSRIDDDMPPEQFWLNPIIITALATVAVAAIGGGGAWIASRRAAKVAVRVAELSAKTTLDVAVATKPDAKDSVLAAVIGEVGRLTSRQAAMETQMDGFVRRLTVFEIAIGMLREHIWLQRRDLVDAGVPIDRQRPLPEAFHEGFTNEGPRV